jgi:hypothetical protein
MTASPSSAEPYCSRCGYALRGLTESARCPECGGAIVDVLVRKGDEPRGRRFRSKATLFGLPAIDIAFGPWHGERVGRARGFLAIGDVATGALAIGGQARGIVALGGTAVGGLACGGLSIGLLTAYGGMAIGGLAFGGAAVGGIACGGGAAGFIAKGGGAIGYYALGGGTFGAYTINPGGAPAAQAQQVFGSIDWLWMGLAPFAAMLLLAGLFALIAWIAHNRNER